LLDYTTYRGYDALATLSRDDLPLDKLSMAYIEFKFILQKGFDHLFKHLAAIVCWQCAVKDGEEVADVGGNRRRLIVQPGDPAHKEHTRYFLDDRRSRSKIEVYVLKEYLSDRAGLQFQHRSPHA
jgi:hypothetical protein